MPSPSPSHKWEGDSAYDPHALHGFAHDSIARGSKSFALASQLFDRETRERVWLLYARSEEHTSELQSLMRISYAVFCLKKKKKQTKSKHVTTAPSVKSLHDTNNDI